MAIQVLCELFDFSDNTIAPGAFYDENYGAKNLEKLFF